MYQILFVKSKFENLYEVVDEKCELIIENNETYLVASKDKHIKLKTNKITNIKDNLYGIFDDNTIFILEKL